MLFPRCKKSIERILDTFHKLYIFCSLEFAIALVKAKDHLPCYRTAMKDCLDSAGIT